MRLALIALGSRGDVQPYIALGRGLKDAGHSVRLVTHQNYARLVSAHGLEFWPVSGDVQAVAESPEMRALLEKGDFLAINARTAKEAERAALNWAAEGLAGCRDRDLLFAGIGGLFVGLALAEKLDAPLVQAYVVPFTPTAAFPGALFPHTVARFGGRVNRWTHHATRQLLWQGFRAADARARREVLGLPPAPFLGPHYAGRRLRRAPTLYGFSPTALPRPADWDAGVHVTGYWFLAPDAEWAPPPAVAAFLERGEPPVCIGFGSMSQRRPEETTDLILRALALAKQRALLLSGWDGLRAASLPDHVLAVDALPHAWLFPRVAAVVHHGGAGTTAAGLRAGVPSIVIPFFGDQPFWGQRVADLGVGPAPIPRPKLTAERLAQAIQQAVSNQAMRQRAAELGAAIRAEDGVARAVAVVQDFARRQ